MEVVMMRGARKLFAVMVAAVVLLTAVAPASAADCGCTAPAVGPGWYGSGNQGDWSTGEQVVSAPDLVAKADVWLLGDSLTVDSAGAFATDMYAEYGLFVASNGQSGRPTRPTVDVLAEWLAVYGPPRLVVMAAGTNDIYGPAPFFGPPVVAGQVNRVMTLLGPTVPVVWVEVHISRWAQPANVQVDDQRNAAWVNTQLWEATGRHPGLSIAAWERQLAVKPTRIRSWLTDGVHLTDAGRAARNETIRREVARRLGL
ncbi:GDSL-type esterase/lipase family protein [Micromonospora sp. NPDC007208]|uniref:GDSL-type esterase/lipase family protein n=1 Tax=Micromonospora sp. NPDC007208 TaxID=3364236 RepID=UPI00367790BF